MATTGRAPEGAESQVERTLGTLASLNPIFSSEVADAARAGDAPVTIDDIYRSHRMGMIRLAILLVDDVASAEPSPPPAEDEPKRKRRKKGEG